jgi:hypothetical protein
MVFVFEGFAPPPIKRPVCAFCADEVVHHITDAKIICMDTLKYLNYMRTWLNTDEGGVYVFKNTVKHLYNQEVENMITGICKTSYVYVTKARRNDEDSAAKYSITGLIPKTDTKTVAEFNDNVKKAIAKGVESGKFTKAQIGSLKLPLRDGDAEVETGSRGPEFKGHFFFNAARYEDQGAPGIVRRAADGSGFEPMLNAKEEFYSGCYARLDISIYPFNKKGHKGVAVGINNCLFERDGERMDGRMKAEDAFSQYADLPDVPDTAPEGDLYGDAPKNDIPF